MICTEVVHECFKIFSLLNLSEIITGQLSLSRQTFNVMLEKVMKTFKKDCQFCFSSMVL